MAQLLGVGEQMIRDRLPAFLLKGAASLVHRPRPGRPPKLTRAQRDELAGLLVAGPEGAGYASACWTAGMIADLLRARSHVAYAPRDVGHLLDLLGFSYQKGKFTADHLNDEAALLWLEETWPEVLRVAREKGTTILFGDEAAFAQGGSRGSPWAIKGVQPTVKTSGIRKAHRVFGLLDGFGGTLYFGGLDGKFNSATYRAFLEGALAAVRGHLIQDNASYHTGGPLRAFYADHAGSLTVYQLPLYSLDLNPIEKLWKKVKKDATHLRYFPQFAGLVAEGQKTLNSLAGKPRELIALAGEYRELIPALP
jgi:transposase